MKRGPILMRTWPYLALLFAGCDATTLNALASCSPVALPFLPDAGQTTVVPITGGPFDAAGFFDDADAGVAEQGESCVSLPCDARQALECVEITESRSACLKRCGAGQACASGFTCEAVGQGAYCLPVVSRGARCEVAACTPDAGIRCLPARAEGDAVLAWTCQVPCTPGGATCGTGDQCLPAPAGDLEVLGPCPCAGEGSCVPSGDAGVCARRRHACAAPAQPGDPALLDEPDRWGPSATCDPGPTQRACAVLDGGTPVWCAAGGGSATGGDGVVQVEGLCLAVCRDPSDGNRSWPCPGGYTCNTTFRVLFHVVEPAVECALSTECNTAAGEVCAGPLPALGFRSYCAMPYGLCQPPQATDGGA